MFKYIQWFHNFVFGMVKFCTSLLMFPAMFNENTANANSIVKRGLQYDREIFIPQMNMNKY